jgi:large-conductance mechanosensitive channel
MNIMHIARIGGQAMAVGSLVREIRRARAEGDKLRLLDAIVNFLAVATTIAIVVREIRNRRAEDNDHDGNPW